jgi:hypothetical protein
MKCPHHALGCSNVIVRYCNKSMVLAGRVQCLYLTILLEVQEGYITFESLKGDYYLSKE